MREEGAPPPPKKALGITRRFCATRTDNRLQFSRCVCAVAQWLVQWLAQVIDLAAESVREGESFTELKLALPA